MCIFTFQQVGSPHTLMSHEVQVLLLDREDQKFSLPAVFTAP